MLDLILFIGALFAFVRFNQTQYRIDAIATETARLQRELGQ